MSSAVKLWKDEAEEKRKRSLLRGSLALLVSLLLNSAQFKGTLLAWQPKINNTAGGVTLQSLSYCVALCLSLEISSASLLPPIISSFSSPFYVPRFRHLQPLRSPLAISHQPSYSSFGPQWQKLYTLPRGPGTEQHCCLSNTRYQHSMRVNTLQSDSTQSYSHRTAIPRCSRRLPRGMCIQNWAGICSVPNTRQINNCTLPPIFTYIHTPVRALRHIYTRR